MGAVLSFGVLTALIFTVYASNDLYNSFRVSNAYYVPSVFNELGFPYCFCHQFTTYPVDKPEGFSKSEAAGWETGGQTGLGKDVSVILVMNEAFSDLTDQSMFNWTEETDPLPNLHALQKDPHALSGHIVVPGFAGGTANTEFDALTGMQTNALSVTATSAMRVVNRNLDSLFRVFGADGYRTSFYHPGDAWFYNRENVYRWLGAEHEVFAKDMKNLEYKGRWVTDDYMAGLIEEEFETAVSEGRPLFNYTTTIQNHMSYTADKYGEGYVFPPGLHHGGHLSDETRSMLEVYTEGVRDADAMLGRLTAYFAERRSRWCWCSTATTCPIWGQPEGLCRSWALRCPFRKRAGRTFSAPTRRPMCSGPMTPPRDTLDWERRRRLRWTCRRTDRIRRFLLAASCWTSPAAPGKVRGSTFSPLSGGCAPVVQKKTYILADGSAHCRSEPCSSRRTRASMELKDAVRKWRCWSYYKLKYADVG
ncbi:MAG: LTA synthase family protein [Dysosmobacter sp.]